MSSERNPDGAISKMHAHTPRTQQRLISCDDRLRTTFMIRGILNNGRAIAAQKAILSIKVKGITLCHKTQDTRHKQYFFLVSGVLCHVSHLYGVINFLNLFFLAFPCAMVKGAVFATPNPSTLNEARVVA